MKTFVKSILIIVAITISFAFTSENSEGLDITYGVTNSDPSTVELQLMEDFRFEYHDYSIPDGKINVSGTYRLVDGKVELNSSDSDIKFHDTWKLSEDLLTAKARRGLCFYTLRRID